METQEVSDLGNKGSFSPTMQTGSRSLPTEVPGAIQHFFRPVGDVETEVSFKAASSQKQQFVEHA